MALLWVKLPSSSVAAFPTKSIYAAFVSRKVQSVLPA
jgi:hypothetical protein